MTPSTILKYRLLNQQISGTNFKKPDEIVSWFGAMQAQTYGYAKWAIGSRLPGITDADIEQSINDKKIIRTWLMRGTIHLVAAEDTRWMFSLLAPRLISYRTKQFGVDKATFLKADKIFTKALRDGSQLTREELSAELKKAGINAAGLRLAYLLRLSSLEQTICFGTRRGKQYTFTLLDNAAPKNEQPNREESLAEITRRYFFSRGPATLHDFVWWSGLTIADAKKGIESVKHELIKEKAGDIDYWHSQNISSIKNSSKINKLLTAFDEYVISYKDRNLSFELKYADQVMTKNGIFYPLIILNGGIKGIWKQQVIKDKLIIQSKPFTVFSKKDEIDIISAAKKYAKFLGISI
jgi:hypothetical protein